MKFLLSFLALGRALLVIGLGAYAASLFSGSRILRTPRGVVHLSLTEAMVAGVMVGLLAVGVAASIWRDIERKSQDGPPGRRQRAAKIVMMGSILSAVGIAVIGGAIALIWRYS